MALYRKRPVEVEAEQWFPDKKVKGVSRVGVPIVKGGLLVTKHYVTTIHLQNIWLEPGDWVITEPDGIHYYPCKDDIFRATYEAVE